MIKIAQVESYLEFQLRTKEAVASLEKNGEWVRFVDTRGKSIVAARKLERKSWAYIELEKDPLVEKQLQMTFGLISEDSCGSQVSSFFQVTVTESGEVIELVVDTIPQNRATRIQRIYSRETPSSPWGFRMDEVEDEYSQQPGASAIVGSFSRRSVMRGRRDSNAATPKRYPTGRASATMYAALADATEQKSALQQMRIAPKHIDAAEHLLPFWEFDNIEGSPVTLIEAALECMTTPGLDKNTVQEKLDSIVHKCQDYLLYDMDVVDSL